MGLDMYLNRKIYVGAKYEHNNVKGKIELTKGKSNIPIKVDLSKVSEITEEVAYWRKANAIHKWFVDNVQDGKDDCGDYYVSREQLQELVDLCKKVLNKAKTVDGQVANGTTWTQAEGEVHNYQDGKVIVNQDLMEELLPTQPGFFFGETDYDEYYMEDLKNTIKQLEPLLTEDADTEASYYYSSSW